MKTSRIINSILLFIRRILFSVFGIVSKPAQIVVYCYHSISSGDGKFDVSDENFKKQIDFLLANFKPISTDDLIDYLDGKKDINEPSFVLSFDDGYKDLLNIKDYLPALGIKPIAFVLAKPENVNRLELRMDKQFLTSSDILSLQKAGWEIGCHSLTHANLQKLTDHELNSEIVDAKHVLESLGVPVKYFAYPKGKYDQKIIRVVKDAGFKGAFSTDYQNITVDSDRFAIPRIGVVRSHTLTEFRGVGSRLAIVIKKLGSYLLPEGIYD